jgi:hypothetical protein
VRLMQSKAVMQAGENSKPIYARCGRNRVKHLHAPPALRNSVIDNECK